MKKEPEGIHSKLNKCMQENSQFNKLTLNNYMLTSLAQSSKRFSNMQKLTFQLLFQLNDF